MTAEGHPATVGRYQLRRELGTGGFATVYHAYDPNLDREVALKVLHPHLARDPIVRERFIREGRALARVDHPCVVSVFDAGEAGGSAYLAMRLIAGRTLSEIVTEDGPLPIRDAVRIAEQMAAAIDAIHARDLIHRDIKPLNIMIEQGTGRAVLLDLGVARDLGSAGVTASVIVGTPAYMAPEQLLEGGEVSPRTDVYQLGATVYALLAGRPPYEGTSMQVLRAIEERPPYDLHEARPDLPAALAAAVSAAMAHDPAERPASGRAFAALLRAALGDATPSTPPGGIKPDTSETTHPHPRPNGTAPSPSGVTEQRAREPRRLASTADETPAPARGRMFLLTGGAALAVLAAAGGGFALTHRSGGAADPGTATATIVARRTGVPTAATGTAVAGQTTTPGTATPAGGQPPDKLYAALLKTPFPKEDLPAGLTPGKVSSTDPNAREQRNHATGSVSVEVDDGRLTSTGSLRYTVYPTDADARARFDAGAGDSPDLDITGSFDPKGFSVPVKGYTASFSTGPVKQGVSYCMAVSGNVTVLGLSLSLLETRHGDNDVACNIARGGLAHLDKVRAAP
jgi:serine/threonine-protein kinase